jgi:hypothetical protein
VPLVLLEIFQGEGFNKKYFISFRLIKFQVIFVTINSKKIKKQVLKKQKSVENVVTLATHI